jgi:PAS domain S-box-containing protein
MAQPSVTVLLAAWRAAERNWDRLVSTSDAPMAAREVVAAWKAYQDAAVAPNTTEFILVADNAGTYAAATRGVSNVLGYDPDELIGQRIEDLAAPELRSATPEQWTPFLADGLQDGTFRLRARDGRLVALRFRARAHHPVPGFHASQLWPEAPLA